MQRAQPIHRVKRQCGEKDKGVGIQEDNLVNHPRLIHLLCISSNFRPGAGENERNNSRGHKSLFILSFSLLHFAYFFCVGSNVYFGRKRAGLGEIISLVFTYKVRWPHRFYCKMCSLTLFPFHCSHNHKCSLELVRKGNRRNTLQAIKSCSRSLIRSTETQPRPEVRCNSRTC